MGRSKKCREYSIKPQFTTYAPCCSTPKLQIDLNHDELEAIFLIDYQDMYQEDAAKLMNISRPTLSRIIKSARNKIATTIISGGKLNIRDDKKEFIVALCSRERETYEHISPKERYIHIFRIKDATIEHIKSIDNPIISTELRPSKIIPQTLKNEDVNFFITLGIGEGLKNSLITQGIFVKEVSNIKNKEDIQKLFN
jgi:predicted DNA-binding protein (UPF0251 family)/predicted Fe-Mo cluster-binding NifX family protein